MNSLPASPHPEEEDEELPDSEPHHLLIEKHVEEEAGEAYVVRAGELGEIRAEYHEEEEEMREQEGREETEEHGETRESREGNVAIEMIPLKMKRKPEMAFIDYTATDRTWSAWQRTSMTVITFGVTLGRLFDENGVVGVIFCALGAIYIIFAFVHFTHEYRLYDKQQSIKTNNRMILASSVFTFIAYCLLLAHM